MITRPLYEVFVSYKADRYFSEENKDLQLDKKIMALSEEKWAGSGMGFGMRDIHFMDLEKKEAEELAKEIRKITKGLKVSVEKQE